MSCGEYPSPCVEVVTTGEERGEEELLLEEGWVETGNGDSGFIMTRIRDLIARVFPGICFSFFHHSVVFLSFGQALLGHQRHVVATRVLV